MFYKIFKLSNCLIAKKKGFGYNIYKAKERYKNMLITNNYTLPSFQAKNKPNKALIAYNKKMTILKDAYRNKITETLHSYNIKSLNTNEESITKVITQDLIKIRTWYDIQIQNLKKELNSPQKRYWWEKFF